MGRRSRRLRCTDCDRLFWTKFEHMTLDELAAFANTTTCSHCDSPEWRVTRETMFAGGDITKRGYSGFQCRDCWTEFYHPVAGRDPRDLADLAQTITCPDCGERDACRLTDQVKRRSEIRR